ncbi:MAG TPA: VOC family protein [Povalibacter sp.]|nr:VOC family protein [Povalibacter sp.]
MHLSPHLTFRGECETAFRFYEQTFGGTIITRVTYGESPQARETPPHWHDKIVHASLTVGGQLLNGVDLQPEQYEPPRGFYVLLGVDYPERAERIFNALAENGVVRMPLQQTFWAKRFGVVVDRFGIPWEINC